MIRRASALSTRTLVLIAALVGVLLAALVFLRVMSHSNYRLTGTNSVGAPLGVALAPGEELCAPHVFVPAGSGSVAPWAGGRGGGLGGPVAVRLLDGSRVVATGQSPASYPTGITRFPLARTVDRAVPDAKVCFTNRSRAPLTFYGDYVGPGMEANAAGNASASAILRLDWYTPGRRSWWDVTPWIADRFPLFKAGFMGAWTFWLALAALAALSVAAVARVVREART
jgi:hypothetical protein